MNRLQEDLQLSRDSIEHAIECASQEHREADVRQLQLQLETVCKALAPSLDGTGRDREPTQD